MGFGSKILNGGSFTNQNAINSFGTIENNGSFTNSGTLLSFGGSLIDNNATFANNNTLSTNDVVRNDGTFSNIGTVNVNAGSVWSNYSNFTNATGGTVNVVQDFNNKPTGVLTNNGSFFNNIRTSNEGSFTNNAYLCNMGDFTNAAGATLTNNELFNLQAGNLLNAGTLVNTDKTRVDECSSVKNTGSINNTGGNFEMHGILIQRGSLTGNAVNNQGGYIHTASTSAAPSLCQNGTYGADINGDIKVYASSLVAFANFDSCANIVYFANGVARPVFHCSDIPTIQNVNLEVRTRLGDVLTCVAQVTPVDQLAPVFNNCPKSQIIFTPNTTTIGTWTAPTATDNCSTVTLTTTHAPGSSFPVGVTTVTYTAKDVYNNQNQCQFQVDVRQTPPGSNCEGDAAGPTFTGCPSNISTPQLAALTVVTWTPPTPADNCKPINLTSTHVPGQVFPVGTTTVTYTAKDGNNNSRTCSFTVTITTVNACANDTQKPIIFGCPANILLPTNTSINGAVAIWNAPNAGDNCGVASLTASHAPGTVFPVGITTVTYTATDAANNSATCSFTITVGTDPCPGDNTGPVISGCPNNINLVVPGASANATWSAPTATDACAPVSVNNNYAPGSTFPLGTTTVSYQFSDKKGNKSTCNFNVTVQNSCAIETVPPVITGCPSNITVAATGANGATATWTPPTATDNCGLSSFGASFQPGSNFPVGTTTVVYTAIDLRGNASNCSFNINVIARPGCASNSSPSNGTTGVNPASVTLTWGAAATATSYDVYLGTVNPPTTTVATNVAGTATTVTNLATGTIFYWYVVPKNMGGSATGCSSSVTSFTTLVPCVNVTNAGAISASQTICSGGDPVAFSNITLPTGGTGTLSYIWQQTTLDPAANPNAWSTIASAVAPTYDPPVLTQSTWYRRGASRSNCSVFLYTEAVKVTVITTPTPQFNLTQPSCNALSGGIAITNLPTGFYSKLDNGPQTLNQSTYSNIAPGPHTITIGSNGCDKSSTFTINALPSSPVATCKNISRQVTPANNNTINVLASEINNGSTGGCAPLSFKINNQSSLSFNCSNLGPNALTLLVTDAAGRSSSCSATITVQDLTPPTLACKNYDTVLDANGQVGVLPANVYQSGSDNCGSVNLVSVLPNNFSCNNLGANTVTLTANDGKGNTNTCTATVNISLNPNSLLSYTILAQEEIHMHKNTVAGNLGIWKEDKEAKIHDETTVNGFVRSPKIDLSGGSTIAGVQTLAQAIEPALASFKYNTMPDPPSDVKVPDNYNGVFLLNGTNFKNIEIGKNSTAKFTATGIIYVKEFISKDSDNGKKSSIQFTGNTELVVKKKVELGKRTELNWNSSHRVKIYAEEDNMTIKESSKINASVDVRFKDLHVDDATEQSHTLLIGQFIAKKVDAKKWVDWSWSPYECSGIPSINPIIINNDNSDFAVSLDKEQVQLTWITNTDHKSDRYIVERSTNGTDFEPLLEIMPETDEEQVSLYSNKDPLPNLGANFYRVRTAFADGTEAISEVRAVALQLDRSAVTLFPNPAYRNVSVYFEKMVGKAATVTIHNSFGYQVLESQHDSLPDEPWRLELGNLPEGMYWLWLKVDGLRERSVRFVVVNGE